MSSFLCIHKQQSKAVLLWWRYSQKYGFNSDSLQSKRIGEYLANGLDFSIDGDRSKAKKETRHSPITT
jgi:hypothetical protein